MKNIEVIIGDNIKDSINDDVFVGVGTKLNHNIYWNAVIDIHNKVAILNKIQKDIYVSIKVSMRK